MEFIQHFDFLQLNYEENKVSKCNRLRKIPSLHKIRKIFHHHTPINYMIQFDRLILFSNNEIDLPHYTTSLDVQFGVDDCVFSVFHDVGVDDSDYFD